ncbi:MAG: hypothetical protein FGF50_08635 [Candidatus Brockarchaeota archaeon]|nr:hypothetical protein [Candidatus Brockarchaeota archaeon]
MDVGKLALALGLAFTLAFILFYFVAPSVTGAPTVTFDGWYQNGRKISIAKVGVETVLKLRVKSQSTTVGMLTVEIRRDVVAMPDETVAKRDFPLTFQPGEEKTVEVSFTPDTATGISVGSVSVREYFYRVLWNGQPVYDPKTPGGRNGLKASVEGEVGVTVETVEFEGDV